MGDETAKRQDMGAIKFPDNYVAQNTLFIDYDLKANIMSNGYKLFPKEYKRLGMKTISELVETARKHEVLAPAKNEEAKILIIKRALNLFTNLLDKHFSNDELDAKIYIFDGKSKKENSIDNYDNVSAEAILWNEDNANLCKSRGFYIDRGYINNNGFAQVLETALHELSHKAGGDGTKSFGYKLTQVNECVLAQIAGNHKIADELRILDDIWKQL